MEKYKDSTLPSEERARDLLSRMTLEEKVAQMDMIRGVELATRVHEAHFCAVDENSDFHWDKVKESFGDRGIGFVHDVYSVPAVLNKLQRYFVEETRLGIPCIFTGEALHGISWPGAQVFPVPLNLGATFDPELTKEIGHAIAAETRSLGIHEILAPNLDVSREPRWGRTEETFGEDTYLSSQMAYAIVSGEQGDPCEEGTSVSAPDRVLAEPKHYCVHGIPEAGTNCSPARVGVREVETTYLPVFEAGIKKAGAYNAMASYNCIDGEAVMCSSHYLREILKDRWGMKGYVRSDFGGIARLGNTHHMTGSNKESIRMAVEGGVDVQGFDFPNAEWQNTLLELVREGSLSEAIIDDAVFRVLRAKFDLGLFEHPYTDEEAYKNVVRCQKHRELCRQAATESIVLLQNNGLILPLDPKKTPSIALIGPSSNRQRIGGYSSVPYGYHVDSLYEVLKERLGDGCVIRQADGCNVTEADVDLIPKNWYPEGITLEFYNNPSFEGTCVGNDHADWIKFNWILAKPHQALEFKNYTVRMKAKLVVHTHDFTDQDSFVGKLVFTTNDSVRVFVDGEKLIDSFDDHKQKLPACTFTFVDGAEHELMIEYLCDINGNDLAFCVDTHTDDLSEMANTALELAKESDIVLFVGGDNTVTSGEGKDRSDIILYGPQRQLIKDVAALGKPLVLILENGKAVDLSQEKNLADAILVTWFGGEMGAHAIADVLLGTVSPAGRLPVSFPKGVGYLPCYYSQLPGGSPEYQEGEKKALYPFGHGLSYTEFLYENLHTEKKGKYDYEVTVDVTNVGEVASDEVVQLYLTDICSTIVTPDLVLKGFERIYLEPGEKRAVCFRLDFESFRLLDRKYQWVVEPGEFRVQVGASSEDLRLATSIFVD